MKVHGRVRFTHDGRPAEAVLHHGLRWTTPAPWITRWLDQQTELCSLSPSLGDPAAVLLHRAAELLGGTAEVEPSDPEPPGRVY